MAYQWHSDSDVQDVRSKIYQQIYTLFLQRKPAGRIKYVEKLSDFVKKLEQVLFTEAKTKEDYSNVKTLESRLVPVARGLVVRTPQSGSSGAAKAGTPQLINGGCNPQAIEQQQPTVAADGVSNMQLILPSAHPAAQSMQPSMGMIPTPETGMLNSNGMVPVKTKAGVVADRQQYIQEQQRYLLFLRHCAKCQQDEDECGFGRSCKVGKDLWIHVMNCSIAKCTYPRCIRTKNLIEHYHNCQDVNCPICSPCKQIVRRSCTQAAPSGMPGTAQPSASMDSGSGMPGGNVSLLQELPTQGSLVPKLPGGVISEDPKQIIAARRSIVVAGLGFWAIIQALLKTPDAQAADTAGRQLLAALVFAALGFRRKLPLVWISGFMIGSLAVGACLGAAAAVNS